MVVGLLLMEKGGMAEEAGERVGRCSVQEQSRGAITFSPAVYPRYSLKDF